MAVLILGIETSCDETAAAVVADGQRIMSNVVASQVKLHSRFGGVVPEVASRRHIETLNPVIAAALAEAGIGFNNLNAVAVTQGPGLLGSLLVGLMAAKSMSFALNIPLIAVNHIEAHLYANFLLDEEIPFPFVAMVVSGGHTDIVYAESHSKMRLLGQTRDDAAGEAFDKVARFMGLGYPGGPAIERLAREGDPEAIPLPRAFLEDYSFDTSFSGLKTAVVNFINRSRQKGEAVNLADVAAGFQAAVVEVLAAKALAAVETYGAKALLLAGGVAANEKLRDVVLRMTRMRDVKVVIPPPALCTDNAAMVAAAGYYRFLRGDFAPLDINAVAGLSLQENSSP
ncbi:MAG: tRNA (adenosine(37)-N6)-threonylcarbamoyltransferase complex transferase subunit TsaD [Bacillota bacterium]